MTTASDIMTPDATCIGEKETLADAARRMASLNVGSLPICGDDNRLKGHAHGGRGRREQPSEVVPARAGGAGAIGRFGRRGLPFVALFSVLLPLLAPLIDLMRRTGSSSSTGA